MRRSDTDDGDRLWQRQPQQLGRDIIAFGDPSSSSPLPPLPRASSLFLLASGRPLFLLSSPNMRSFLALATAALAGRGKISGD
jgi:hypothetical protein